MPRSSDPTYRILRASILDQLDRLMVDLLDPSFRGSIDISIPAKDGSIGDPKVTTVRYGVPTLRPKS